MMETDTEIQFGSFIDKERFDIIKEFYGKFIPAIQQGCKTNNCKGCYHLYDLASDDLPYCKKLDKFQRVSPKGFSQSGISEDYYQSVIDYIMVDDKQSQLEDRFFIKLDEGIFSDTNFKKLDELMFGANYVGATEFVRFIARLFAVMVTQAATKKDYALMCGRTDKEADEFQRKWDEGAGKLIKKYGSVSRNTHKIQCSYDEARQLFIDQL